MEKKPAKIFKKFSEEKLKVLKEYKAKSLAGQEKKTTIGVAGSRLDFNLALAKILDKGSEKEQAIIAKCLRTSYYEDWDSEKQVIIKY